MPFFGPPPFMPSTAQAVVATQLGTFLNEGNSTTISSTIATGGADTAHVAYVITTTDNTANTHASFTADSNAMTKHVDATVGSCRVSIWLTDAEFALGSSTITVAGSVTGSPQFTYIGVVKLENLLSTTPTSSGADTDGGLSMDVTNFNISAGGVCFAGSATRNDGSLSSWDFAGITPTEIYDEDAASTDFLSAAFVQHVVAVSAGTINNTMTGSTPNIVMACASFR